MRDAYTASRRGILRTGMAILAGGALATAARAQDADSKVEQECRAVSDVAKGRPEVQWMREFRGAECVQGGERHDQP